MVALDKKTMRPCKGGVPPIVLPPEGDGREAKAARERVELAAQHRAQQARERAVQMSTRLGGASHPPTTEEMASAKGFQTATLA